MCIRDSFFAKDEGFPKNRETYDINNLYRYESLFREDPDSGLRFCQIDHNDC